MNILNKKHQLFLDTYIATKNATDSYLLAYPKANKNTASANSTKLLKKPAIIEAIKKAQKRVIKRTEVTVEKQITRLNQLSSKAEKSSDFGNAIKALQEQNKLLGLYEINHLQNLNTASIPDYDLTRLSESELDTLQQILSKAYVGSAK